MYIFIIILLVSILIVTMLLLPFFFSSKSNHCLVPEPSDSEELVLSVCSEDIRWVDKFALLYDKITVFNQCNQSLYFNSKNVIVLNYQSSRDHAFLSYIVDRYDDLPKFIEFTDGNRQPRRKYMESIQADQFSTTANQLRKTSKREYLQLMKNRFSTDVPWLKILTRVHPLVVVAIFKNEAHIMKEWLQHYTRQGVTHFYLINNGSTDNWELETMGFPVTVHTDTVKHKQISHYNSYFLHKIKKEAEWLFVVDLDEFMYARLGFRDIPEYLQSVSEDVGQISVQWLMFGSCGHVKQPESVINGFVKRLDYDKPIEKDFLNSKSICRTRDIKIFDIHNSVQFRKELSIQMNSEDCVKKSPLHLNHYAIQSLEFFTNVKMTRGDVQSKKYVTVRNLEYFNKYDCNEIEDTELAKLAQ